MDKQTLLTQVAIDALQAGDAEKIGMLIKQAQSQQDKYLSPSSPRKLTAPLLHTLLNYSQIQTYIFGSHHLTGFWIDSTDKSGSL
ncbi:hypothetical protein [Anabaena catenula]|uniref:Uncharacterized protein n=1 Tax=Anabaena catenula FACHB-362 TaxID=2692877 RepID=A0ABR8JCD7_9NOST|nr:hypothetical protein [Anabaena catenula]MBD2694969.1 hypothetical protein [Anabaena catenula FACHB-362]